MNLNKLQKLTDDVRKDPCNCEQTQALKIAMRKMLDWVAFDALDAPDMDLFDVCVKLSNWRYNKKKPIRGLHDF